MSICPWMVTPPPVDNKSYLCKMEDGYIKMCFYKNGIWLDMWKITIEGEVKMWTLLPDELVNVPIAKVQTENYMEVAEKLYYHINPTSKMDVPNSAYVSAEKWYKEWSNIDTNLTFFDWCLKYKS